MEKEITCHLCGGKTTLKFREIRLLNGKITIKNAPYYDCQKCHEQFATSEQMRQLSDQIQAARVHALQKGKKVTLVQEGRKQLTIKISG